MPTIGPSQRSRISNGESWCGIDTSGKARLKVSEDVLRRLDDYGPGVLPGRPEAIDLSDFELRAASAKGRRGAKLVKKEREALALFGTWRATVRRIEAVGSGNLTMLLGLLNVCEAADRGEDAQRLRRFMLERYGASIPGPPAPYANTDWAERWADRYSQNREVLPLAMRTMDESDLVVADPPTKESEEEGYESF